MSNHHNVLSFSQDIPTWGHTLQLYCLFQILCPNISSQKSPYLWQTYKSYKRFYRAENPLVTGGYVALYQALQKLVQRKVLSEIPLTDSIAAVSCGIVNGEPLLDLNYIEDSGAEVDANFIMTGSGALVEIQACAEKKPFSTKNFNDMLSLAQTGIQEITEMQKKVLKIS